VAERIDVLDHGFVELVRAMGDDDAILQAARVSTGAAGSPARDRKLLDRLARLHHSSPFEHVALTFHVKAPRFVMYEWQRHRTWSYLSLNEYSQRYRALDPPEFYRPAVLRHQSTANKQAAGLPLTDHQIAAWRGVLAAGERAAAELYDRLLEADIAREQARIVLPQSVYTELYATVKLWNLADFWRLRLDAGAQFEIREYAAATMALTEATCPVACAALWAALEAEGGPLGEGATS
jgi:thymidylate synthase (FAD)